MRNKEHNKKPQFVEGYYYKTYDGGWISGHLSAAFITCAGCGLQFHEDLPTNKEGCCPSCGGFRK